MCDIVNMFCIKLLIYRGLSLHSMSQIFVRLCLCVSQYQACDRGEGHLGCVPHSSAH